MAFLLSLATPHQIPKIEISSASLNSLYKIIPVLDCKNFTLEFLIGKRLIFRYDRKIPDYFSVAGAP